MKESNLLLDKSMQFYENALDLMANATPKEKELFELLCFEDNIKALCIKELWEIDDEADVILTQLFIGGLTGDQITVPFVHFHGHKFLFTPLDWQLDYREFTPEDIKTIDWRVDDTTQQGIVFNGLPRLAPWCPPIDEENHRTLIGLEIKKAREKAGISIRQLAIEAGMGKNNVVRIEQGKYNYTIDNLFSILNALNLRIEIKDCSES